MVVVPTMLKNRNLKKWEMQLRGSKREADEISLYGSGGILIWNRLLLLPDHCPPSEYVHCTFVTQCLDLKCCRQFTSQTTGGVSQTSKASPLSQLLKDRLSFVPLFPCFYVNFPNVSPSSFCDWIIGIFLGNGQFLIDRKVSPDPQLIWDVFFFSSN